MQTSPLFQSSPPKTTASGCAWELCLSQDSTPHASPSPGPCSLEPPKLLKKKLIAKPGTTLASIEERMTRAEEKRHMKVDKVKKSLAKSNLEKAQRAHQKRSRDEEEREARKAEIERQMTCAEKRKTAHIQMMTGRLQQHHARLEAKYAKHQGLQQGEQMKLRAKIEKRLGRSKQTRTQLMSQRIEKLKDRRHELEEKRKNVKLAEEERKTALAQYLESKQIIAGLNREAQLQKIKDSAEVVVEAIKAIQDYTLFVNSKPQSDEEED